MGRRDGDVDKELVLEKQNKHKDKSKIVEDA